MGIFSKSKKKPKESPIPENSEFPMKAYVYRLLPEKVGRIQVAGRVQGDYDGFTTAQDLEDMVAKICGGGTYRCKVVKSQDTKTHIGYHTFVIPGAPMIEGQPVDAEKPEPKRTKEEDKVSKIEEEIEVEEAQARLDETKARRRSKQKQLGLIQDDDDDDDGNSTPSIGMGGFEDPRITQLLQQQKAMERRLEEKDREMERKQHEHQMAQMEERMRRELEAIKAGNNAKQSDGGVAVMMNAQMEAIKALMTASQQSTQAMMQSNGEMIKLIMTRDPGASVNDRVDKLVEKLLDTKSQTGKEVMEAMKESFNTGIMMARGGEQAPTSMADVAREFSGRVCDIVGNFVHQKGQMSKEVLTQEIQKAASKVVSEVKASILPQAMRPRHALAGAIPAGEAMPDSQQEEPSGGISRDELRARVDRVMEAFIADINDGTETWKTVAQNAIPRSELARIGELSFDNVAHYCMMHGSRPLVRRVFETLIQTNAITPEQANFTLQNFGVDDIRFDTQTGQQGQTPHQGMHGESDEDVLADEDDDDALMDDDSAPQGDAVPVPVEQIPPDSPPQEQPKPRARRGRKAQS